MLTPFFCFYYYRFVKIGDPIPVTMWQRQSPFWLVKMLEGRWWSFLGFATCTLSYNKFHSLNLDVKCSALDFVSPRSLIRSLWVFGQRSVGFSILHLCNLAQCLHRLLNCYSLLETVALSMEKSVRGAESSVAMEWWMTEGLDIW